MKTRNERLVISDLAVHKLLPFCTMYLCRHCQSWWSSSPNTDHFWKMLRMSFVVLHWSINDWSTKIKCIYPISCALTFMNWIVILIFVCLIYCFHCVVAYYCIVLWILCICMILQQTKIEIVMGCLHLCLITSRPGVANQSDQEPHFLLCYCKEKATRHLRTSPYLFFGHTHTFAQLDLL